MSVVTVLPSSSLHGLTCVDTASGVMDGCLVVVHTGFHPYSVPRLPEHSVLLSGSFNPFHKGKTTEQCRIALCCLSGHQGLFLYLGCTGVCSGHEELLRAAGVTVMKAGLPVGPLTFELSIANADKPALPKDVRGTHTPPFLFCAFSSVMYLLCWFGLVKVALTRVSQFTNPETRSSATGLSALPWPVVLSNTPLFVQKVRGEVLLLLRSVCVFCAGLCFIVSPRRQSCFPAVTLSSGLIRRFG